MCTFTLSALRYALYVFRQTVRYRPTRPLSIKPVYTCIHVVALITCFIDVAYRQDPRPVIVLSFI